MKSVSINGIARVNLGKSFAKQLRKENNVPCVVYGGKDEPVHFYAHENEFRKIVYTPNVYLVDIIIGDQEVQTIMRDIQFHPVTDKILHIDFLKVFDDKKVQINIPVVITGNSIGVRNGGRLALNMRRVMVEAFAKDLPETIEVDITQLRIGTSIRISDLSFDSISFLNNPNDVVVAVKTARAAVVDSELEDEGEEAAAATEGEATEGEAKSDGEE
ncbi:MAG: 50S ribosomal protein L25/general stress protein Ctc [Flavobacteriales bacterium]|nr:50S ribosomal protein L25/general stress protein Ctc [Flavobacteriales bacterium]